MIAYALHQLSRNRFFAFFDIAFERKTIRVIVWPRTEGTGFNNGLSFKSSGVGRAPSGSIIQEEDETEEFIGLQHLASAVQTSIDLSSCKCAEVLASVFPQLVDHWRAAGNKLKTMRYLTESGAAALATSANMQALSYLYEVLSIIEENKKEQDPLATREETARVESLIGQVT